MIIEIKPSGTGAHCAKFVDASGCVRHVYSLNGESAAKAAAKRLMGATESGEVYKPFIKISDILKFSRALMLRRNKNKLANKSRAKNRN